MTYAGPILTFLLILCIVGIAAHWFIDFNLPTAEEEEARAKRDMEALIKRTNEDNNHRPRVRAGNQWGMK